MRYISMTRRFYLSLALIALGAVAAACGGSNPEPGTVHVLTWDGIVNPVMDRYIDRGLDKGEESEAAAVVIKLDTPGGLESTMRDIVQRMEASRVPVIVWVAPSGGRAASAGTFITMAGQVAAMAPNTSIGAASAINSDGSDIEGALGRKIENDAVAFIRGIADLRGRNADWAEDAVRDAVAVNETQAVELNVVDFVAETVEDLLRQSNGRVVRVPDESGALTNVTVQTAGASVFENDTTLFEEVLYLIADPNIAFLLLTLGGLMLVYEIFNPSGITGVFGVIALVLAYFALGSLPTNWAGVVLIILGFILIGVEVFMPGFGAFGVAGIISMMLGGLILTGSSDGGFQVSRWLVFGFSALIGLLTLGFLTILLKSRRMPSFTGRQSMIGAKGVTRGDLRPEGPVLVQGERWQASAEDPPLSEGTHIIVTGSDGFKLTVKRDPAFIPLLPEGREAPSEPAATPQG